MAIKTDSDAGTDTAAATPSRSRAAEVYETARDRTASAYEAARDRATDVTRQAADQLAVYPVGAVIGGFAVGALLAALLPRSEREDELLGTTGRRLTGAARDAAQKGLEAGRGRLDEITGKVVTKVGSAVVDAVGGKS